MYSTYNVIQCTLNTLTCTVQYTLRSKNNSGIISPVKFFKQYILYGVIKAVCSRWPSNFLHGLSVCG